MNFAHFCEFCVLWILCFSLGKQARFTLNCCSGMPLQKVHELAFLGLVCRGDSWFNRKEKSPFASNDRKAQRIAHLGALKNRTSCVCGSGENHRRNRRELGDFVALRALEHASIYGTSPPHRCCTPSSQHQQWQKKRLPTLPHFPSVFRAHFLKFRNERGHGADHTPSKRVTPFWAFFFHPEMRSTPRGGPKSTKTHCRAVFRGTKGVGWCWLGFGLGLAGFNWVDGGGVLAGAGIHGWLKLHVWGLGAYPWSCCWAWRPAEAPDFSIASETRTQELRKPPTTSYKSLLPLSQQSEANKRGRPSKRPPECLLSKFADFECAFSLHFLGENMTPTFVHSWNKHDRPAKILSELFLQFSTGSLPETFPSELIW